MQTLLHRLNSWYSIIGVLITAIGLDLWTNEHYFFWPPQYVSLMNDDRIDAIATFVGISLIIYALTGAHNNWVIGILLGLSAAFMTIIAIAFYLHMTFAGQDKMSLSFAFGVVFILIILKVANSRNTKG